MNHYLNDYGITPTTWTSQIIALGGAQDVTSDLFQDDFGFTKVTGGLGWWVTSTQGTILRDSDGSLGLATVHEYYETRNAGGAVYSELTSALWGGTLNPDWTTADSGHWLVYSYQAPIPEPATIALLAIGLAGLAGVEVKRRRKKKAVDKS